MHSLTGEDERQSERGEPSCPAPEESPEAPPQPGIFLGGNYERFLLLSHGCPTA
jgi:hypothetical protein